MAYPTMQRKRAAPKPLTDGRPKLTLQQVREIREAIGTRPEIAKRFRISPRHVSRIKRGEHWKRHI